MKRRQGELLIACWFGVLVFCFSCPAEYSVDWFKISGGGGTSISADYLLSGTIGQPDVGNMSGGDFIVQGGFWSLALRTQSPGLPLLSVTQTGTDSVTLSWPYPSARFGLEQTEQVESTNWTVVAVVPVRVGSQWQVTLTPLSGYHFYRLRLR